MTFSPILPPESAGPAQIEPAQGPDAPDTDEVGAPLQSAFLDASRRAAVHILPVALSLQCSIPEMLQLQLVGPSSDSSVPANAATASRHGAEPASEGRAMSGVARDAPVQQLLLRGINWCTSVLPRDLAGGALPQLAAEGPALLRTPPASDAHVAQHSLQVRSLRLSADDGVPSIIAAQAQDALLLLEKTELQIMQLQSRADATERYTDISVASSRAQASFDKARLQSVAEAAVLFYMPRLPGASSRLAKQSSSSCELTQDGRSKLSSPLRHLRVNLASLSVKYGCTITAPGPGTPTEAPQARQQRSPSEVQQAQEHAAESDGAAGQNRNQSVMLLSLRQATADFDLQTGFGASALESVDLTVNVPARSAAGGRPAPTQQTPPSQESALAEIRVAAVRGVALRVASLGGRRLVKVAVNRLHSEPDIDAAIVAFSMATEATSLVASACRDWAARVRASATATATAPDDDVPEDAPAASAAAATTHATEIVRSASARSGSSGLDPPRRFSRNRTLPRRAALANMGSSPWPVVEFQLRDVDVNAAIGQKDRVEIRFSRAAGSTLLQVRMA